MGPAGPGPFPQPFLQSEAAWDGSRGRAWLGGTRGTERGRAVSRAVGPTLPALEKNFTTSRLSRTTWSCPHTADKGALCPAWP